jgi:hypothetical protein
MRYVIEMRHGRYGNLNFVPSADRIMSIYGNSKRRAPQELHDRSRQEQRTGLVARKAKRHAGPGELQTTRDVWRYDNSPDRGALTTSQARQVAIGTTDL